jgi:hemolysin III
MPSDQTTSMSEEVGEKLHDLAAEVKPRLRGWLHAAVMPLAVAGGVVLVALSPTTGTRLAAAVFMLTAMLLFGVSAIYHTGSWTPQTKERLKRFDHANIFLLIAGSYTPFALLLLEPRDAAVLLILVWSGAVLGVAFRVFWLGAPRWLYVPVYIALGWAAVFWMPAFADNASAAVLTLLIVGGGLYSVGAVVYGFKRPNPAPNWFGFHEIFHSFTIAAFTAHYVGISLAAYSQM